MTNRQTVILTFLREHPGGVTIRSIHEGIEATLVCPRCDGVVTREPGQMFTAEMCRACWGRGRTPFGYSDVYPHLIKLLKSGHVDRFRQADVFGDETSAWLWVATGAPAIVTDPLEAAFLMPSAER